MLTHLELYDFSPAEVAKITGLSPESQRDWRRRGILSARTDGRSSFTSLEVAELLVRRSLNDLGVSLSESAKAARLGGAMAIYYAVLTEGALSDDGLSLEYLSMENRLLPPMEYLFVPPPSFSEALHDKIGKDNPALKKLGGMLPVLPAKDWKQVEEHIQTMRLLGGGVAWGVIDLAVAGVRLTTSAGRPLAILQEGETPPGPYFLCYRCEHEHGEHSHAA